VSFMCPLLLLLRLLFPSVSSSISSHTLPNDPAYHLFCRSLRLCFNTRLYEVSTVTH
jgi:hypothetical protein